LGKKGKKKKKSLGANKKTKIPHRKGPPCIHHNIKTGTGLIYQKKGGRGRDYTINRKTVLEGVLP